MSDGPPTLGKLHSSPQSLVGAELRSILAANDVRHGEVAKAIGRSDGYVSACLHGRSEFKEHELVAMAGMLGVPESWASYPGHALRRFRKLESVPHSVVKVMLRVSGWRSVRNTPNFTIWQHPSTSTILPLPTAETMLVPTLVWWVIDTIVGVKLPKQRLVQDAPDARVYHENDAWLIFLPQACAYTQASDVNDVCKIATEFGTVVSPASVEPRNHSMWS